MDAEKVTSAKEWSALARLLEQRRSLKVVDSQGDGGRVLDTVIELTKRGIKVRTYERGLRLHYRED